MSKKMISQIFLEEKQKLDTNVQKKEEKKREKPEEGYLHNIGISRSLSQGNFSELGEPLQVYPATYFWKEGNLKVIGDPISWSDFKKKIER